MAEFDNQELVRSTGQRMPSGTRLGTLAVRSAAGHDQIVDVACGTGSTDDTVVIAPVEVEGLDVFEEAPFPHCVEGARREHEYGGWPGRTQPRRTPLASVAIELLAGLAPIRQVGPGALAATGGLVQ